MNVGFQQREFPADPGVLHLLEKALVRTPEGQMTPLQDEPLSRNDSECHQKPQGNEQTGLRNEGVLDQEFQFPELQIISSEQAG
jgi:hypothetical protein